MAPSGAIESRHIELSPVSRAAAAKMRTAIHTSVLSFGHGSQPEKHGSGRYSGSKVVTCPCLPGIPSGFSGAARFIQQRHCTGFAPVSQRFCNRASSIEVCRFGCPDYSITERNLCQCQEIYTKGFAGDGRAGIVNQGCRSFTEKLSE